MKVDKWEDNSASLNISTLFRINTPQKTEVNKIYTIPHNKNTLVTKSDLSSLHLFDISTTTTSNSQNQRPSATLTGHEEEACESNFALDTGSQQPWVLSGDKNGVILLWDIEANVRAGGGGQPEVNYVQKFQGHTETVEDVCFRPDSSNEFCSVGDDQKLLFWDARSKLTPVQQAPKWCTVDLHCVDWNQEQLDLLVTGDANGATVVFDRRKMSGPNGEATPLYSLHYHEEGVYRVGWLPKSTKHFASGGEDSSLFIWDLDRVGAPRTEPLVDGHGGGPPEVIFKHSGHRGSVQDLQWNPTLPWVMGSVSEDAGWAMGGGTMQLWRPLDFLYHSDDTSVMEIEKLQSDMKGAME